MIEEFTKRKFLKLESAQRHKHCAQRLRRLYESLVIDQKADPNILDEYNTLLSWMGLNPAPYHAPKEIADRYHWHLSEAGRNLKEHNLLPQMRRGDRTPQADYLPIAIYLDRVRSAYNVGSILRTNEALRIGAVHFSEKTPFIDNEKVERTAMGAAPLVHCYQSTEIAALPRPLIALDTCTEATPLNEYLFPPTFTLVLGNEEYGISDAILSQADVFLEIPMLGAKNSLNVACAFAIAAAEIRRQTTRSHIERNRIIS